MESLEHPAQSTALARVIDRMGEEGFGSAMLDWLAPVLRPTHATAFRFDAGLQARVVLTASIGASGIALESARVYSGSGLYRHDQLIEAVRRKSEAGDDGPVILRLRREDIDNPAYGEQLWDRFGLLERVSALSPLDGHWSAINLYRDRTAGRFQASDIRRFASLAPLMLALLRRHLAALHPSAQSDAAGRIGPEAAAALLMRLPVRLSAREREVCALTLAGHTREGIGLGLGIAPSSVATLRRRAYRKLQIHGTGELFALCLHHGGHGDT